MHMHHFRTVLRSISVVFTVGALAVSGRTQDSPLPNRGIERVNFVPGSGPGVWKVKVDWYAEVDSTDVPVDLGCRLDIFVSDMVTPVEQLTQPLIFRPIYVPARCPNVGYFTMSSCIDACSPFRCGEFQLGADTLDIDYCDCRGYAHWSEAQFFCPCFLLLSTYSSEFTLLPGFNVRAKLVTVPPALPEVYPWDDSLDVVCCPCCQSRGNADGLVGPGGPVDVADLTYLVAYLFQAGSAPPCEEEGNVDGMVGPGGPIDVADLTYLVAYLFLGGASPPPCLLEP